MLIPRWVLKVAGVVDRDPERPALGVVHVERDGKNRPAMYATDGKRALGVMWKEPNVDEWPAPAVCEAKRIEGYAAKILATDAERAHTLIPRPGKDGIAGTGYALLDERCQDRVQIHTTDLQRHNHIDVCNQDVKSPDIPALLRPKRGQTYVRMAVNPLLLAETLKALHAASGSESCVLSLTNDKDVMLRVETYSALHETAAVAVVMGQKISEEEWNSYMDPFSRIPMHHADVQMDIEDLGDALEGEAETEEE